MSMEEADAMEFYEDVVGDDDDTRATTQEKIAIESKSGREISILLKPIDRKFVIDKLNKLPKELLEMFDEIEDPEDAENLENQAGAGEVMSGLSGQAIEAFEELCAEGMHHHELTQHHFDDMVSELDLEILFEIGALIIEMSLEDDGDITGFRKLD